MAGKIFRFDPYDIRKYEPYDIKTIVDIGASNGTVSIMARVLQPSSRILAFEPARATFDHFQRNMQNWAVECYRLALGDGSPMYFKPGRFRGENRFTNEGDGEAVDSIPLSEIFKNYKVETTTPYIVKIDCEGGEVSLLRDPGAFEILSRSTQFMIELHPGVYDDCKIWEEWIQKFGRTHNPYLVIWDKVEGKKVQQLLIPLLDDFRLGRNPKTFVYVSKEWGLIRARRTGRLL